MFNIYFYETSLFKRNHRYAIEKSEKVDSPIANLAASFNQVLQSL